MNRRFFACSVGEPGKDYVDENLDRILSTKTFVLHDDAKQKGSYESIKPGDILLLKYNHYFIGYGKTTGRQVISNLPLPPKPGSVILLKDQG